MATTQLIHTVAELRQAVAELHRQDKTVGLVPTMGALHEGHLSLVHACQAKCDATIVTIFVNPTQFGPGEDIDKYPRTLEADMEQLTTAGVDLVFAPAGEEVYREGHVTYVEVGGVAEPLEGVCRPGHFRGVVTVVLKLLNMAGADKAFFGQKDYQQLAVLRQMVRDLDVPTRIEMCPTVREKDGLAMSSRNRYLSPEARQRALILFKGLELAMRLFDEGCRDAHEMVREVTRLVESVEDARIDYVAIVDAETLAPIERISRPVVLALAVKIEDTRLIDNCLLYPMPDQD